MKKIKDKKIEPEKWYTLQEIVNQKLFYWCRSFVTYQKYIIKDKNTDNFLKATITNKGRQTRYHIKGKNIIEYLENVENGNIVFNN